VGGLRNVGRGLEAQGFEECSCPSATGAQAQFREALPGLAYRTIYEHAANAPLPVRRQHIDPPDAPDPRQCAVRIETHTADPDDALTRLREIKRLSFSNKSIQPLLPFRVKAIQVVPTLSSALGEEGLKPLERQVACHIHVDSQAHWLSFLPAEGPPPGPPDPHPRRRHDEDRRPGSLKLEGYRPSFAVGRSIATRRLR